MESETDKAPFEYKEMELVLKNTAVVTGFRSDPLIKLTFRAGLFLILLQIVIILINFNNLPSVVPLFYSLPWGEKRLADSRFLFMLPSFSLLILFLNFIISKKVYDKERLLSRISLFVALTNIALSVITLFQIVIVIT